MATTRFSYVNRIEAAACTLLNGTGGGAPARDEVAGYLMENAETSDRYTVWKNSGGVAMNVDYDLGSDVAFNIGALLGHRPTTAAGTGITAAAVSYRTAAAGYVPAGPWNALGSIAIASARDAGLGFGAGATGRYVRFALTVGSAFTLGRFFIGAIEADLLTRYAPGAQRGIVAPRRENMAIADVPVLNWMGDNYETFNLPFLACTTTLRDKLVALAQKRQTVVYADHNDVFREVLVRSYSDSERWAADDMFDGQLELLRMP